MKEHDRVTHTPGPWRWMNPEALVADYGPRRAILTAGSLFAEHTLLTCGDDGRLRPLDIDEPNARLIAAAPELLTALILCRSCLNEEIIAAGDLDHPTIRAHAKAAEQAAAAIAKAEGR